MSSPNIVSNDILPFANQKYNATSIVQLRTEFPDFSDETLARFLIARDGNVEKALIMLREHVVWREENLPVYKDSCLGEILKGKVYAHGIDKEGHPLIVFRPAKNDMNVRDIDEMFRMAVWWSEAIFSQIPSHLSKATLLVNRTGGENNADVPFIRLIAGIFQANYPERLHKAIIYPSGYIFWALWNMLKYLADPVTQKKILPVVRLSGVQEHIDDIYIPTDIGGTCVFDFDSNKNEIISKLGNVYPEPGNTTSTDNSTNNNNTADTTTDIASDIYEKGEDFSDPMLQSVFLASEELE